MIKSIDSRFINLKKEVNSSIYTHPIIKDNKYFEETGINLKLFFFKWHDALEAQHAQHTWSELEEVYLSSPNFDTDLFIDSAVEMLDGVSVFWKGLDKQRSSRVSQMKM